MTDTQKSNKPLFSQHYLTFRIQETPEWQIDVTANFETLKNLYLSKKAILPTLNESQTEDVFIKPVLELLGFKTIPQVVTRGKGRAERPDYALFANESERDVAYTLQNNETAFYSKVLVIAEAKYWERQLSKVSANDKRDIYKNENPSFQISSYLTGTNVDWGILTNGKEWRLYYRQASSTATEFYPIDLVELLEGADLEKFKYFWLFFRSAAFIKDNYNKNFLERVREGSTTYATQVGNELKTLVFEQIFPQLAGGFVADGIRRGKTVETKQVYAATLSFLYKLLFILYAEARNLLPITTAYRDYSLIKITQEIAESVDKQKTLSQTSTKIYKSLLGLFEIVDRGDAALEVPRYNGGLFHCDFHKVEDIKDYPDNYFLYEYQLSDAVLFPALDKLARFEKLPIDYSFLGVRQLGSIYEGLLEYCLVIEDGNKGKVHLENDKGERKATGSYYTPDYIVKYIVSHTLKPILQERKQQFADLMMQIHQLHEKMADGRLGVQSNKGLQKDLQRLERKAQNTLLDIKICDPAMGSGHFLVEAVDFLTDELIAILNEYPEYNPVLQMLEVTRNSILQNLQQQGITIDVNKLEDTQLLQRVVMKRCIYGVDLNLMAVELAKVSLWLHSFTIGAPLSFLDHHLRCGNSLIGTTAREAESKMVKEESGSYSFQLNLLTGPFVGLLRAAEIMRGVSTLSDANFAEVETSERLFKEFDKAAKPYKRLLDVYVSQFFGVKQAKNWLERFGTNAISVNVEGMNAADFAVYESARMLFEEKRFFHWDLEFPEVFIDLENASWKDNSGFDAVIGNPPYVNVLNIDVQERDYLLKTYNSAQGRVDIYILFFDKALDILKIEGICGVITPNKYFVYGYGNFLRKKLLQKTTILNLVDLAKAESIFPEAATYTVISIFKNQVITDNHLIDTSVFILDEPLYILDMKQGELNGVCAGKLIPQNRFLKTPVNIFSLFLDDIRWKIYEKTYLNSMFIRDKCDIEQCIRIGSKKLRDELILTTSQYSKILESQVSIKTRTKPIIDAEEVEKYWINWEGRYLIYDQKKLYNPKSEELFEQKKIVVKDIGKFLTVGLDISHENSYYYALNTVYIIVPKSNEEVNVSFLAAILNSPLSDFLYKLLFGALTIRGGYLRFREYIQYLPIREISFTTLPEKRQEYLENTINLYQQYQINGNLNILLSQVENHLNQQPSQADVIHDLLAYLAEQMISLNQQKQTETKGFLTWLARFIGTEIDNLTNKSKIQNYLGDYYKQTQSDNHLTLDELIDILKKNKKKVKIDITSRQAQETLSKEYQSSLNILLPIKKQLKQCDWLIDEIVYKLYGLTEEEKAIIAGE
ncbi:Eco57I restriction-modification methylase domain-containing protein [Anabaena sp. FACHB-1237]|uniref:Eco57I restriction-modification methylase domain-containing protein n=1 Tax=Anabaena sp. FACHB-1237 TaxID=2692769 RepID=UPI0016809CF1|nr:TaqI-like C-terminal specificity domain-containing protein [Anabaena sp. FACHB-1237]MBD2137566.1 Eco57I restriction-modification methylase domain-containing protein [Anabaena sp. FACHB-1237]